MKAAMATRQMEKFMQKNKTQRIVFGERRTPENKPVLSKADIERADRVVYRFEDGSEMILLSKDSRSNPAFRPLWLH